jgi:uncharacterized protein (TIGR02001 family)
MKKLMTLALCVVLAAVAVPALALGPVDVNADLTYNSKYVWRGMTATDDAVIQPGFSANLLGFGVGFWGNIDTSDYNDNEWEFNEVDYTLAYELKLPLVSFGAGLIYYDFPNTGADGTTELYLSASASVLLSPSLTVYQDIDAIKGAYWEASLGHGVPLSPAANLNLKGTLGLGSKGYLAGYFGVIPDLDNPGEVTDFTGASMSDLTLTASVPYQAVPFFTLTPAITYSTLLGDAKDAAKGFERNEDAFYYGLTLSFSF